MPDIRLHPADKTRFECPECGHYLPVDPWTECERCGAHLTITVTVEAPAINENY